MKRINLKIFILVLFSLSSQGMYLVVNKNNDISKISKNMVSKMFLGRIFRWPNNDPAFVADYVASHDIRKEFSNDFLNEQPFKVYKIWIRNSLSGKSAPPHYFKDEAELLNYVSQERGAIGYVKNKVSTHSGVRYLELKQ